MRGEALVASKLEQLLDVGEIRRNTLLRKFGTLEPLAGATDEELREAGVDAKTAAAIRNALTSEEGRHSSSGIRQS